MPHFIDDYADKLRGSLGLTDSEAVLDLRGAHRAQGEASVRDLLERSRFGAARAVAIKPSRRAAASPDRLASGRTCTAQTTSVSGVAASR